MDNLKLEYIWIASHQYEGWELPWSAVCELKSEGRWTYSFSWNQRPENQKNQRYKFQSDSESLWTGNADGVTSNLRAEGDHVLTHSVRQRVNSPFLCLFILLRPSPDWIMSTHTREGKCFTQSTNENVILIQKHPQRHIQKLVNQILGHPVTRQDDTSSQPPQMDMELSHVDIQSTFSFQVTIHLPF